MKRIISLMLTAIIIISVCSTGLTTYATDTATCKHYFNSWETIIQPTCGTSATVRATCYYCGFYYDYETGPVLSHDWHSELIRATCQNEAIVIQTCNRCGATKNEVHGPRLPHEWTPEIITPATCISTGLMTYTCHCGETYTEVIPISDDHTESENWIITKEATCTESGRKIKYCTVCDGEIVQTATTINALGHSYTSEITTPATCISTGLMTYTCHCGDTYTKSINPIGHSHTGKITTPATCISTGIMTYTCHCENTYTEEIPVVAHTEAEEWTILQEPTCTEYGRKIKYCVYCNEKISTTAKFIYPTGHSETEDWITLIKATCTDTGVEVKSCVDCYDVLKTKVIPAGHNYTCVEHINYKEYTCQGCGDYYKEDKIIGDIDDNGYISISDVTYIQKVVVGITEAREVNLIADLNNNGEIDTRDATYIQLYLAKKIDTLSTN